MALTVAEEAILKLIAARELAKAKLEKVNLAMETDVQSQVKVIADSIRKSYESTVTPLQLELSNILDTLKAEAEK